MVAVVSLPTTPKILSPPFPKSLSAKTPPEILPGPTLNTKPLRSQVLGPTGADMQLETLGPQLREVATWLMMSSFKPRQLRVKPCAVSLVHIF